MGLNDSLPSPRCPAKPTGGTPLVTIVIPTYNRKRWLREAISSVLAQDCASRVEIVVVDDGSTDGTAEAIADLLSNPRIRYVWQNNTGSPAAARNRGIACAAGELIAFLDSDDRLLPGSIERRIDVLRRFGEVALVSTDWLCFADSTAAGTWPSVVASNHLVEQLPTNLIEKRGAGAIVFATNFTYDLINGWVVNTSTVMIRRSILDAVGPFDESIAIAEDYDLWLRISMRARMAFIDEPLSLLRIHDSHLTGDERRNFLEEGRMIERFLQRSGPVPAECRQRLASRLSRFYDDGSQVLLRTGDRSSALLFLVKSLRYRPLSWTKIKRLIRCVIGRS